MKENFFRDWHGLIRILILILFGMWLIMLDISIFSWQFWAGLILFLGYGLVHVWGFTEEFINKKGQ